MLYFQQMTWPVLPLQGEMHVCLLRYLISHESQLHSSVTSGKYPRSQCVSVTPDEREHRLVLLTQYLHKTVSGYSKKACDFVWKKLKACLFHLCHKNDIHFRNWQVYEETWNDLIQTQTAVKRLHRSFIRVCIQFKGRTNQIHPHVSKCYNVWRT